MEEQNYIPFSLALVFDSSAALKRAEVILCDIYMFQKLLQICCLGLKCKLHYFTNYYLSFQIMRYIKQDIPLWAFWLGRKLLIVKCNGRAKVTSVRLQSCPDPWTDMLESHQGSVSVRVLINCRRQSRVCLCVAIMPVFCLCTLYLGEVVFAQMLFSKINTCCLSLRQNSMGFVFLYQVSGLSFPVLCHRLGLYRLLKAGIRGAEQGLNRHWCCF